MYKEGVGPDHSVLSAEDWLVSFRKLYHMPGSACLANLLRLIALLVEVIIKVNI